jgi:hypothetical protein
MRPIIYSHKFINTLSIYTNLSIQISLKKPPEVVVDVKNPFFRGDDTEQTLPKFPSVADRGLRKGLAVKLELCAMPDLSVTAFLS